MNPDTGHLLDLADAASEGAPVDWEGEAARCASEDDRRLVRALEFLASVLEAHRRLHGDRGPGKASPRRWGPLELLEEIGRGAFGTIYRARDPNLDRIVALKLRPPGEGSNDRALDEGRMMARVRHAHVVAVYGAERHEGRVGLWMEFVEGESLEAALGSRGTFGAGEAVAVGLDLCGALAAVHAAGLVHGDVKTENVMRESGGRLVLMDFSAGSSRAVDSGTTRATTSGTPLFMAPEILAGQANSVRSDVYSLGVVLFRLLTGRYPVEAADIDDLETKLARGVRTPLRDLRPDLPAAVVEVVERSLAHDPEARFATVGELESALSAVRRPRSDRPVSIRKWSVMILGAVLLALVVTALWNRGGDDAVPFAEHVEIGLWRVAPTIDQRLAGGERIRPGDHLYAEVRLEEPGYLYVVNFDERGAAYLLFPVPDAQHENPLPRGRHRLPGETDWAYDAWEVSSAGGEESFLIVAANRPLERLEATVAELRPATPRGPTELDVGTLDAVRGVGRLAKSSDPAREDEAAARLQDALGELTASPLTRDELFVTEIVLRNP